MKDITNRYKLLRGFKVNYVPGWDCHGLPIELKAVKGDFPTSKGAEWTTDPLSIRAKGLWIGFFCIIIVLINEA